jgi:phosphoribosylformylglycinamidine synthase
MGERTPVALLSGPASGRMAIGEAITNLAAADVRSFDRIKLSANWMAAAGHKGEDAALFDTVKAVALDFCPSLGLSIPVGKDSLSMKTRWQEGEGDEARQKEVVSPLSLVITAFAPVEDVRKHAHTAAADVDAGSRYRTAAARPGPDEEPPRRVGLCAGLRRGRRNMRRTPMLRAARPLPAGHQPPASGRLPARLPRPLRRRPVRHAVRNGVRVEGRSVDQSRRLAYDPLLVDVDSLAKKPDAVRVASMTASSRRCSTRNWVQSSRSAWPISARR